MLTDEQVQRFGSDGYLVIPDVVPEPLLAAADAEVAALMAADPPPDDAVGKHVWFLPPSRLPAADAALRKSGALDLADSLVAPHHLDHALGHIQVALSTPGWSHRPGGPHIDGHRPEMDQPDSFTMLAAVFLGDERSVDRGNLWVWPGSHLRHQALFRAEGTGALLEVSGHSTMLDPPLVLAEPVPVLAGRGDLLLAHFLLGHNSSGNEADQLRRILYFRLCTNGHRARWAETFLDVWTEYAPVRAALGLSAKQVRRSSGASVI